MTQSNRYQQAKKVILIGALVNALLGLMKLLGGIIFHSHALFADGVHSFSDLFTDVMVLFASKYGSVDADDTHPYGHQRIETAATLLLSLVLILAGSGIAWDAVDELLRHESTIPNWMSMPVACISILANELSYQYTHFVGKRINSPLLTANAWHHRSDAASSFVVLVGLIGSFLGYVYLDAVAAVVVALMIIKMGWTYGWNSVKELVDTAVSPELLIQIRQVIHKIDGVLKIHQLRSRFMGNNILIDVHILVSPKISVSEGHYIAQHVDKALTSHIPNVSDVVVHVDPEDDEQVCPSLHLPSRKSLQKKVLDKIREEFPQVLFWNIHYLDGKISIDIICSEHFTQWNTLHDRVTQALNLQEKIEEIRLFSVHERVQRS